MAKVGDSIKDPVEAQIRKSIIFLLDSGATETEVRRFVESVLNEARRG